MKIGTPEYTAMGHEAFRKLTAPMGNPADPCPCYVCTELRAGGGFSRPHTPTEPFVVNHCAECDKPFRDLIAEYICFKCRASLRDDGASGS